MESVEQTVSVSEYANIKGKDRGTIYNWIKRGKLKAVVVDGATRIQVPSELIQSRGETVRYYYTTQEVCEILKLSKSKVCELREEGLLVGIKQGNRFIYPPKAVETYVENLFAECEF